MQRLVERPASGVESVGEDIATSLGLDEAIGSLEVDVHTNYDARGELAPPSEVRPGYLEVRWVVRVASPAPEEEVLRVLDTADRRSTFVDLFSNCVPLRREVQFAASAACPMARSMSPGKFTSSMRPHRLHTR